MEKILNYINGELVEPVNGNYLDNYNPSNGQVYSLIPDSEKEDIDNAVASAKEAFKTWGKTTKQERSDILMKLADTIEKYSDELIKAESKDNGKPETLAAHVDIPRAPANIRFFAGAILHDSSKMHEMDGGVALECVGGELGSYLSHAHARIWLQNGYQGEGELWQEIEA